MVVCDEESERLPLCGSEYDTGERCVVSRPRHRGPPPPPPPRPRTRESDTPRNPAGPPPRAPGAPWPNRAEGYD